MCFLTSIEQNPLERFRHVGIFARVAFNAVSQPVHVLQRVESQYILHESGMVVEEKIDKFLGPIRKYILVFFQLVKLQRDRIINMRW